MTDKQSIKITINGKLYEREVESRVLLSDFLRHEIGLTGTHVGCEHGVCGACTVLVDGHSARSCLMFAVQADGADVRTVESLADAEGNLNVLQEKFREHHALQCGYCTPGILMTMTELLNDNPDPTEAEVREVLTGNLCRCTGYAGAVEATLSAAAALRTRKAP